MKKVLFALLTVCVGAIMPAEAQQTDIAALDNTVYIEPVSATAGQELSLSVKMKNTVAAEGFQFNLTLPEGMTFVKEKDGKACPAVTLSNARGTSDAYRLYSSFLSNGSLSVLAGSAIGKCVSGNDGEVCTVSVKVSEAMSIGNYLLILKNIAISDDNAKSYNTDVVICPISVSKTTSINDAANAVMRY